MTDKTTPAFHVHQQYLETGLTIRDYFAAKAMQGLLASTAKGSEDQFAEYSYKIADAMLRAREGV